MSEQGTRVTCEDIETGESETAVVCNDFIVITDGRCYVDGTQIHSNGTVVITLKKKSKVPAGGDSDG